MRWGLDWAVAGIAGALFARIALDILRKSGAGGMTPLVYSVLTLTAIALLQFIVLRRHGARATIWLAAAAAVWTIERAGQWLITGGLTPGPAAPPLSRTMALSLTAGTALLEGLVLAWIVLRRVPAPEALAQRGARPGWRWVEWTAGGALALVTVMGAAGLVENVFRESERATATAARPLLAVVAGLNIGGLQWLLLRRQLARPAAWLVASMAALAVPALALPMMGMFGGSVWLWMMSVPGGLAALGAWFGFCQWLVLRRHVTGALLWIPATAAAWACHYFTLPPTALSPETVGAAAGAVLAAAIQTGGSANSRN
jgi:hypothetical protein